LSLSHDTLVMIDDLNLVGVSVSPNETETPLVVDPYAMLPPSLSVQGFQTIPRRRGQIS